MSVIAVIPARGGSKRIPRKNIKNFLGKPMLYYPAKVLQDSGLFDRIIVSTDDDEIANVALALGAEVPFMRPDDLADDHTGTAEVITHAINWLSENDVTPSHVCCVYPTAPFLTVENIEKGWELIGLGWKMAFSVTSFPYPIQRSIKLRDSGGVEPFFPEYTPYRSQDLEPAYHDAGQFYWGVSEAFMSGISMFSEYAAPVVLPRHQVQDIDDEEDWLRAELMFRAYHGHNCHG